MSDSPLGRRERLNFKDVFERMDRRQEFLVHLGDIHERQLECDPQHFVDAAETMRHYSPFPTFVLPGDNDWYECVDQWQAWLQWKHNFLSFQDHWPHQFDVVHQKERPENFVFLHKSVLFVGVHIVSATVRDWDEWNAKVHDNTIWFKEQVESRWSDPSVGAIVLLSHAFPHHRRYREFYNELVNVTSTVTKPFLFVQGDLQQSVIDRPFPSQHVLRVAVDKGGNADPTEIQVNPLGDIPFRIKRRQ